MSKYLMSRETTRSNHRQGNTAFILVSFPIGYNFTLQAAAPNNFAELISTTENYGLALYALVYRNTLSSAKNIILSYLHLIIVTS